MRGLRAGRLARPSTATPHPASTRQQAAKSSHPSPARGERKEYEMTTLKARPAAVALTPNAEARIAKLMAEAPEGAIGVRRSEEHTSELQSLMRISYAGFCLKKKHRRQLQKKRS